MGLYWPPTTKCFCIYERKTLYFYTVWLLERTKHEMVIGVPSDNHIRLEFTLKYVIIYQIPLALNAQ